mmetsp:Transcript_62969/g.150652  ORF Transcript_62969/g.150652 Transcript_62969/m.150652 type:complete len:484 (+) Transcript_62969:2-1453(+)
MTTEERLAALESLVAGQSTLLAAQNETILELADHHGGVDSGDTAWILTSTALVLMMTIPGLALFYGGMARAPNVLNTVMQSFAITCEVTILWFAIGYSLAFGEGNNAFIGGSERFWLIGDPNNNGKAMFPSTVHPATENIPEAVFMMYQCTFAVITPALICGSSAERMKFESVLVFVAFWHLLVYCPIAHWEWHSEGFLHKAGTLDFAGGDVVHISSGVAGLVCAIMVGRREGFGSQELPPHNVLLTFMGASLLWVGWFGFNAGSAIGANGTAGFAMLTTHIAASVAGVTWMAVEWYIKKKPSLLGLVSGAVMGLVMITPGSGFVDQTGAFFIGLIGGVLGYFSIQLKHYLGFDDALDAFGVHGIGGIVGGILTGFFANPEVSGESGAFYGNGMQVALQLYGIVVVAAWSGVVTAILLKGIDMTLGLRVSTEHEQQGLDFSIHGENIPGAGGGEIEMQKAPVKVITVGNTESLPNLNQVAPSP